MPRKATENIATLDENLQTVDSYSSFHLLHLCCRCNCRNYLCCQISIASDESTNIMKEKFQPLIDTKYLFKFAAVKPEKSGTIIARKAVYCHKCRWHHVFSDLSPLVGCFPFSVSEKRLFHPSDIGMVGPFLFCVIRISGKIKVFLDTMEDKSKWEAAASYGFLQATSSSVLYLFLFSYANLKTCSPAAVYHPEDVTLGFPVNKAVLCIVLHVLRGSAKCILVLCWKNCVMIVTDKEVEKIEQKRQ